MAITGNQIIAEALLLINRIFPGQTPSTDEQATGQVGFNSLLDEWSATGLAVYSVLRNAPFTLVSGTADYTIGSGGTISVARPVKIEAWAVLTTAGQTSSGKPVDAATFAAIATDRSAIGARIQALNYDAAFPLGNIHLYPKPNGGTLELWVWTAFTQITDFTTAIVFPTGYLQAVIYNLAVALAPKFRMPLDPGVRAKADESRAALGAVNAVQHQPPPATR